MNERSSKVVLAEMTPKQRLSWTPVQKHHSKRLLRNTAFFAAVSACLGIGIYTTVKQPERAQSVMSHLTSDFEYDDTLGRLQFVSSLLPQSAMVFMNDTQHEVSFSAPSASEIIHTWSEQEPWLEYSSSENVSACSAGEIVTIVENHQGKYTVRMLHDNGYESIYSGLESVTAKEYDYLSAGQSIGIAPDYAGFELRKEGLSVLPVFSDDTAHAN